MASSSKTTEKQIESEIVSATAEEPIETKKVILKSSDGELFEVDESLAKQMVMVKNVLDDRAENDSSYSSSSSEPIPLVEHVEARNLAVILEYLNKSKAIKAKKSGGDAAAAVKEMGQELANKLKLNEEIKAVILATNYLELKEFQDVLSQNIADRISTRPVEFVREFFGIENDDLFTPEEEAKIRAENRWAFDGVKYDED
ncbi:SKP1-like protein 9 [Linum grandiflorum]